MVGDLVYGRISYVSEHESLENKYGRIHNIHDGSRGIFCFGNRYAPDYYEGRVPDELPRRVDLLARSGLIGTATAKSSLVKDPTRVNVLGYVVDSDGKPINTRDFPISMPKNKPDMRKTRAKMILHVGTSMNSGKSTSAMAACWALNTMGHGVRAAKVTGTASLKDILFMQDAGASKVLDFTSLGYPSTYMLEEQEVEEIFLNLDWKMANNKSNYWVVEFADGILQRETAMLLRMDSVRSRIHKLVLSAGDVFGAYGAVQLLKEEFGLVPDAISGRCTASPLMIDEMRTMTDVPIYDNIKRDLPLLADIFV